jgi:hypothetical protein
MLGVMTKRVFRNFSQSYFNGFYTNIVLSRVRGYARRINTVLDRMIGFISTSVTVSLNYKPYSALADLHNFQFTAAHAVGFSVSTSRCLVADLNAGTIPQITMKSLVISSSITLECRPNSPVLILQSLYCTVLTCTQLISICFH